MDLLLLQALTDKQRFRSLHHVVPQGMMSPDTNVMLQWYKAYWDAYPEHRFIDVNALQSLVRLRCGHMPQDQVAITLHLAEQLRNPVDEHSLQGILGQLHELDLAGRAGAILSRYNAGEEVNLAYELNRMSQATVRSISQSAPDSYIDTPIEELLAEVNNDSGVKFRRLTLLREHIGGLFGGASIAIGARPDKGKTSLIASILTDFAPQLTTYFGEGRPILWLNNEGSGKRIIPRVYQAALQKDLAEIGAMSNRGELIPAYAAALGGDASKIRVKDMHGASLAQIEQVIEAMRPAVVVADMLANFRLGTKANGANKADEVEQLWQEWREMAVRHDFIGLATVQVSADGDNMWYPPYSALKDSKTGIQGATDVIILLGAQNDPASQSFRGISTPKNKFQIAGKQSYVTGMVLMDSAKCAFSDYTQEGA